ncbi:hypothetical protein [Pinibacter aurantiacus]|uniref:Lipocalin-like domain-containing protein n=1 Tax=Pinibacter aurantiacus TaxID=2851599 RepID=A0A9E2S395_9BACT|nr:hypothetical protein [Pinibacter aurantiacus]MBV4355808.1 hypothetical protein [Pinibacter aurantiacus]
MKHLITAGTLLLIVCLSCKKEHTGSTTLSGFYLESLPNDKFTVFNFVGDTLFKTENGVWANPDTFRYVVSDGYITLTKKNTSRKLEFSMTDTSSFKIENIRVAIPENPKTYMVFTRRW